MPEELDAARDFVRVMLDGAFVGKGWQGATLSGALRGVTVKEAVYRPRPRRRCIWEHVLHAAYWKHRVAAVIAPEVAGAFERSPSNWPKVPRGTAAELEEAWRRDKAYLVEIHGRLVEAAARVTGAMLGEKPRGRKWTLGTYLAGAAAHDAYHLGQIQLLKRLVR